MPLSRLEPCASKDACTVLRGLGAGNRVWLPDHTNPSILGFGDVGQAALEAGDPRAKRWWADSRVDREGNGALPGRHRVVGSGRRESSSRHAVAARSGARLPGKALIEDEGRFWRGEGVRGRERVACCGIFSLFPLREPLTRLLDS